MQIVIEIPEEMYEQIKDGYVPLGISKYLKNGTPLEKIRDKIKQIKPSQGHFYDGVEKCLEIIDKSKERITE